MLIEFGHKGTAFFANNRIFLCFFVCPFCSCAWFLAILQCCALCDGLRVRKYLFFLVFFLISSSRYSNNSLFFCYKNIYV